MSNTGPAAIMITPPSYVLFPFDDPFDGVSRFVFVAGFYYSSTAGFRSDQAAGVVGALTHGTSVVKHMDTHTYYVQFVA